MLLRELETKVAKVCFIGNSVLYAEIAKWKLKKRSLKIE